MIAIALFVAGLASAANVHKRQTTTPQYFQTTPELYAGPTPTGQAAFLAQTNPAPFPSVSYIPPQPLETQVPISGAPAGANIYQLFGSLSHYFPNPVGFGVDEYPLPSGANIVQLHMLSRHGSRYPASAFDVVAKFQNNSFTASGPYAFLNTWKYQLGAEILVPIGKQELFDSGTLHQYLYGHLYLNDGTKIVARSTTEDRMVQSAEYFLAGFFGLQWPQNATLELIIEDEDGTFNNSLVGAYACDNTNSDASYPGDSASATWQNMYLADAVKRFNNGIKFKNPGVNLTVNDVYDLQELCAYETIGLGYSAFCDLFTYEEWQGFEYDIDIQFQGDYGFQSPVTRAVGIGWIQEFRARLQHRYLKTNGGSANITLDTMPSTFPLNQTLYFDFSHDTNINAVLVAFGLRQFAEFLPATHILENRTYISSYHEPFAARLDIEIIQTPHPVNAKRPATYGKGGPTTYVHFLLNQRTIPLGMNYDQCEIRDDGWCEINNFMAATANAYELSMYDYACFGNYSAVPYGKIKNGNPSTTQVPGNNQ